MGEPARNYDDEVEGIAPTRPSFGVVQGGGETSEPSTGHLSSVPTGDELEDQEAAAGEGGSLFNPGVDKKESAADLGKSESGGDSMFNPEGDKKSRLRNLGSRLRGLSSNKKIVLGVGAGTAGLVVVAALLLFIMLSSLKVVQFMEHVSEYQFAKVTRQMSQNTENITEEKIAVDSADSSVRAKLADRFAATQTGTKIKDTWDKMGKYSVNKIAKNFNESGTFKINYTGDTATSITMVDRTLLLDKPSGFKGLIPGIKFKAAVDNSREIAPFLDAALKADKIGPVTRFRYAAAIRKELGISLVAWNVGKYSGDTEAEAKLQESKDLVKAIENDTVEESKTSVIDEATHTARDTLTKDESTDAGLISIVDNNGVDTNEVAAADAASSDSILRAAAGALSPVYSIGMPICLIYDGASINTSAPTINAQTASQIKAYNYADSAASQIRNGYGASAEGNGAFSARLDNITLSPSEMRANGETPDTSQFVPTQASATGEFTPFDAVFGGGVVGKAANFIADNACPSITDPKLAIGAGLINLGVCVLSEGTSCSAEKLAQEGADRGISKITTRIITKIFGEEAATKAATRIGVTKVLATKSGTLAKDVGKNVLEIAATTFFVRLLVMQRANSLHNGLQSKTDLTSDIDSGASQESSMLNQRQFMGRPLNDTEVADSMKADHAFVNTQNEQRSLLERYGSLSNPDSLLSKFGMLAVGKINTTSFSSILQFASSLLIPQRLLGGLASIHGTVHAGGTDGISATANYGNVTFGYSKDESDKLANDSTYLPLENQYILDDQGSSQEGDISSKYMDCFDGSKKIGDMLADKDTLPRDSTGNVVDGGHCSPDKLGLKNKDYCTQHVLRAGGKPYCDLVFRWRVAESYNNTMDQLIDAQDVTASDGSSPQVDNGVTVTPETGNAQQLAQSILNNPNIDLTSYSQSVKQDVVAASQGQPGTAGAPVSVAVLQLIATVGKTHKVLVTAIESNGQGHSASSLHYSGDAVDFGSLDGQKLTGRDVGSTTIISIAEALLPKGSGFGQTEDPNTHVQCGPQITLADGFIQFPDTCNHLHVQVPKGTP